MQAQAFLFHLMNNIYYQAVNFWGIILIVNQRLRQSDAAAAVSVKISHRDFALVNDDDNTNNNILILDI